MADHPRSRGEHDSDYELLTPAWGSSPLARGARTQHVTAEGGARIIPARAGSTSMCWGGSAVLQDHPRSRGEHIDEACGVPKQLGSSPLARGARAAGERWGVEGRIIPARAGSTDRMGVGRSHSPDHPRSRGEHTAWTGLRMRCGGSSPLARGALRTLRDRERHVGIIPARAGSTPQRHPNAWARTDHPRSRGEHNAVNGTPSKGLGSSPLARGAPH